MISGILRSLLWNKCIKVEVVRHMYTMAIIHIMGLVKQQLVEVKQQHVKVISKQPIMVVRHISIKVIRSHKLIIIKLGDIQ